LGEQPGRPVGGGELRNVDIKSDDQTNVTFPFALSYRSADDPGSAVFADLGQKCGFGGGRRQNIVVNYRLTVKHISLIVVVSMS
jgi:hypothetical protein